MHMALIYVPVDSFECSSVYVHCVPCMAYCTVSGHTASIMLNKVGSGTVLGHSPTIEILIVRNGWSCDCRTGSASKGCAAAAITAEHTMFNLFGAPHLDDERDTPVLVNPESDDWRAQADMLSSLGGKARVLIDLIDALRADGVDKDIEIPQIAVIGDQSSAKSSVLEAISGISFPRGNGLVTRCATELRMKRSDVWRAEIYTSIGGREAAEALDTPAAVRACIERLTSELCGADDFSPESIIFELESPTAPDLTLIDLPGIVRTGTAGQKEGNKQLIDELIAKYMQQKRTILLAMVPLTQDIATVEVLERCAKHDPDGSRTIGVLTKPDLINPGAEQEAVGVLLNKTKPLRLGYVMTKGRSQQQLIDGMSLTAAPAAEAEFFRAHAVFSSLPVAVQQQQLGTPQLQAKLSTVLVSRISADVPVICKDLSELLKAAKAELLSLGGSISREPGVQQVTMSQLVYSYCAVLHSAATGSYEHVGSSADVRLCTMARDSFDSFKAAAASTRPVANSEFVEAIKPEMYARRGEELPGFMNYSFFKSEMAKYIEKWDILSTDLLTAVVTAVQDVLSVLAKQHLVQFPELSATVLEAAHQVSQPQHVSLV
jgi:interferon-induced GTP-binding protein Mx